MSRRRTSVDPHPDLVDAVSVSRFWSLVDRRGKEECWPWLGYTDDDGYGIFSWRGRREGAHEMALSFTSGEKRLDSLDTCHSCDNPSCVNPAHLRFATRRENVADMDKRGRRANGNQRLTADQVVEMRRRRASGARQEDLASQYGISRSSVSMIVRGAQWKNAGGPIQTERKYQHGR